MLKVKTVYGLDGAVAEIDEEEFHTWLAELRSGKYTQTKKELQNSLGFCCLGVACSALIPPDMKHENLGVLAGTYPSDQPRAPSWLKQIDKDFLSRTGVRLTHLNDIVGLTFNQIADFLEHVYVLGKPLHFKHGLPEQKNTRRIGKVLEEVLGERERQDTKWGVQNHNPFIYLSILGEEVGEAHQAAIDGYNFKDGVFSKEKLDHLREELIQVAAVAVAMVESLDRVGWKGL